LETVTETHSTLPSTEQIRIAIQDFYRGGGTTNLIVNVCRREMATIEEASRLAEQLASRAAAGRTYVTDDVVTECLEAIRAADAWRDDARARITTGIGSPEWHKQATERAKRNFDLFFPGQALPLRRDDADAAYAGLVRKIGWNRPKRSK
jgi:hypothetical protein